MDKNNEWYFVRVGLAVLIALGSLFLLVGTIYAFKSMKYLGSAPSTNTITVSGHGEKLVVPDLAEVNFSVEKTAPTVADAQKQVTTVSDSVLAALKDLGIEEKDMQTSSYTIYPQYEQVRCAGMTCGGAMYRQNLVGYTVNNSVTVKIHDLDKAGDVLAKLGTTGVTNLSGLNFSVENPDEAKNETRDEAIAKAKAEAENLAKALGVRLVSIVSYSENGGNFFYAKGGMELQARDMAANGAAQAPSIQPGENKISSDVTITYQVQ